MDLVQGLPELLVFHRTRLHRETIADIRAALAKSARGATDFDAFTTGVGIVLAHMATVGILLVGIPLVRSGHIDGIMLAVLCLISVAAFEAVTPLPQAARLLRHHVAAAGRLFEILDAHPSVTSPRDPSVPAWSLPEGRSPCLAFQGLSHTYPGAMAPSVRGLDLAVKAGSRVAIVGPSGAGKTTLAHLVQRFWDPDAGRILIDGGDIRLLKLDDLRRSIGVVSQETSLFSGTIAENLLLAKPSASRSDLEAACRTAEFESTLKALPEGLDTWIGEQGHRLSGGQRQRLGVARTLLQEPAILILDEPTAQLDGPTASRLMKRIFQAFAETTTIHISHRLMQMEAYDSIFVIDDGCLVQQGRHSSLVARRGLYRRLWEAELAGSGRNPDFSTP